MHGSMKTRKEICLPFSDFWVVLFAGESRGGGLWTGKEETGDSVSSVSIGGGSGSTTENNLIESEKKSRKAKPTKRKDTANFTKTWLCLWNDDDNENGFDDSNLISFTIWCRREAKKSSDGEREKIEGVEVFKWETGFSQPTKTKWCF